MLSPPRLPGPFAHRVKGGSGEQSDPLTHASIMGRAGEANGGGVFRPEGIRRAGRVRADASRGLALRLPYGKIKKARGGFPLARLRFHALACGASACFSGSFSFSGQMTGHTSKKLKTNIVFVSMSTPPLRRQWLFCPPRLCPKGYRSARADAGRALAFPCAL